MSIKSKLFALLSYFSILFIFPLNYGKKNEYVKYHAKQGVVLFIFAIAITFSFRLPVVCWILLIAYLVIWATGVINALTGKKEPMPVVGRIAERISI